MASPIWLASCPLRPNTRSSKSSMPSAHAQPAGEAAAVRAAEPEPEPEPEITPLSALEFRRFVEPQHPPWSVAGNTDGWVDVNFGIDKKGKTVDIWVVDSEPAEMFDQAALSAVRRWRFEPYLVDGQATATDSGVRLRFKSE